MCGVIFFLYFEESCRVRQILIRVDCTVTNLQGHVKCVPTWHQPISICVRVMKALGVDPGVVCVNVDHVPGHAGPGPHKQVRVAPASYCTPIEVVHSRLNPFSNRGTVPTLAG